MNSRLRFVVVLLTFTLIQCGRVSASECAVLTAEESERFSRAAAELRSVNEVLYGVCLTVLTSTLLVLFWKRRRFVAIVYGAAGFVTLVVLFVLDGMFQGCGGPGLESRSILTALTPMTAGLLLSILVRRSASGDLDSGLGLIR
jgi:hypothetical protein